MDQLVPVDSRVGIGAGVLTGGGGVVEGGGAVTVTVRTGAAGASDDPVHPAVATIAATAITIAHRTGRPYLSPTRKIDDRAPDRRPPGSL